MRQSSLIEYYDYSFDPSVFWIADYSPNQIAKSHKCGMCNGCLLVFVSCLFVDHFFPIVSIELIASVSRFAAPGVQKKKKYKWSYFAFFYSSSSLINWS